MNYLRQDTIVAISTPQGTSGIGIVRISGKDAISIADKIFLGKIPPSKMKSHTLQYGRIIDYKTCEELDTVLLTVMRAPKTYTREDVVEINCHGGSLILRKVLDLVVSTGASLAYPGEFTARALINGRVDLIQATGIKDLIEAKCDYAIKLAHEKLKGKVSLTLNSIKDRLFELLVQEEAAIDFPEEEIYKEKDITSEVNDIINELNSILKAADRGDILKLGIRCPIVGKPNAGKSTLFNALLAQPRAIVTDIPGTTRDTLEEHINLDGFSFLLIDTAGIRTSTEDIVEKEGIFRTESAIASAFLILTVLDISRPISSEDFKLIDSIKHISPNRIVVVINKVDLPHMWNKENIQEILPYLSKDNIVETVAKDGKGIDKLIEIMKKVVNSNSEFIENSLFLDSYMKFKINKAIYALKPIINNKDSPTEELLVFHIKEAYSAIASIVSPFSDSSSENILQEELLEAIFSKFCIGK